jgi:hypothetical protein
LTWSTRRRRAAFVRSYGHPASTRVREFSRPTRAKRSLVTSAHCRQSSRACWSPRWPKRVRPSRPRRAERLRPWQWRHARRRRDSKLCSRHARRRTCLRQSCRGVCPCPRTHACIMLAHTKTTHVRASTSGSAHAQTHVHTAPPHLMILLTWSATVRACCIRRQLRVRPRGSTRRVLTGSPSVLLSLVRLLQRGSGADGRRHREQRRLLAEEEEGTAADCALPRRPRRSGGAPIALRPEKERLHCLLSRGQPVSREAAARDEPPASLLLRVN